ncbi:MAG: NAD-dependent isocitrate dehydrogenase [Alphaproteobacteria bacterium]|nr:NAD-dependent isocitrate dehydrogenase [Alphaproteobacteria bacterium]
MRHEVTLVPGDCPALFEHVRPVIAATGVDIAFDEPSANPTVEGLLASARRTGTVLMGYEHGRRDLGELAPVVQLREKLGVFCNLRPVRNIAGLPSIAENVDLLIVRETTEDIYAHLEHESIPGVFEGLKVTTRAACERIARHAFEIARQYGRKRVTIVHKANIMKLSDGMFLRTAQAIAKDYPDIEHDDVIVDALCMKLILNPERFDVLLTGNLFGDIVADLCTGLVGGTSNAPSINTAPDCTLFTAGHRVTAEEAEANPMHILVPLQSMLAHLGEDAAAARLHAALETTLTSGVKPTVLGGSTNGAAFCAAVVEALG